MGDNMNITIDVDSLRHDLIDYFGTASMYNSVAMADLVIVQSASDSEVVNIAIRNGFNLYDYEIKNRSR